MSAELARALLRSQFPDLADAPLALLGRGWDMDVWRCGGLVFRFPRRPLAIPLCETELRVLPQLAPLLPVRIPVPSHIGRPEAAFPAPFYGHPYLPGRTADRVHPDAAERCALAPAIARFLRTLHQERVSGVPPDPFRGAMQGTSERALLRIERLERSRWAAHLPAARARLQRPPPEADGALHVLLHGDFYLRHLLLDRLGELAGVIDWGDVCLGDPAVDLSIAYTFLPEEAHPDFFAVYGEVDAAVRTRACHRGLAHSIGLLAYAVDVGDAELEHEAGASLLRTLTAPIPF